MTECNHHSLRKETRNPLYHAPRDLEDKDVVRAILHSCTTPFSKLL